MDKHVRELAEKACSRVNNRDLIMMVMSSNNLSDEQYKDIESYSEFKGFTIYDSGEDIEGRDTLFMIYTSDDGNQTNVVIERDNGEWRVLE